MKLAKLLLLIPTLTLLGCGADNEPLTSTSVHNHTWDEGVITPQPDSDYDIKTYTCTGCGETKTEYVNKSSVMQIAGHVFVGKDIQEKNYVYYDTVKEALLSESYFFDADGSIYGAASKTFFISNGVPEARESDSYMMGTYAQNGNTVSLVVTGTKNGANSSWSEIPVANRTTTNAVVSGNDIIIETQYPDSNHNMVTIHMIITLQQD